jgi:hypothetical protein
MNHPSSPHSIHPSQSYGYPIHSTGPSSIPNSPNAIWGNIPIGYQSPTYSQINAPNFPTSSNFPAQTVPGILIYCDHSRFTL